MTSFKILNEGAAGRFLFLLGLLISLFCYSPVRYECLFFPSEVVVLFLPIIISYLSSALLVLAFIPVLMTQTHLRQCLSWYSPPVCHCLRGCRTMQSLLTVAGTLDCAHVLVFCLDEAQPISRSHSVRSNRRHERRSSNAHVRSSIRSPHR